MFRYKTFLCIIPARGGSTRLRDKNILPICDKPLIYWVIKAAQDSRIIDRLVVSTDSQKIADKATLYGAEVQPRPAVLATAASLVRDTMIYALSEIEKEDKRYDYVLLLEATSPLTTGRDIKKAAKVLFQKEADMVISVSKSRTPMGVSKPLPEDHSLKGFLPRDMRTKRSQDHPQAYQLNGAIYLAKWDIFAEGKDYYEQNTYAYITPDDQFVDINDNLDFKYAESLLRGRLEWWKVW